jgi:hypothetical protein
VAFVIASVARQTFILASFSLPIAQSLSMAQSANGAVVLGHWIADFDIIVTIVDHIFLVLFLILTLPLTAAVL